MRAFGIGLAAVLALAAPRVAAAALDRRIPPRLAAAVHLWALIGMGVAPVALLLCLAGPGSPAWSACQGAAGSAGHLLAWGALGGAGLVAGALAVSAARAVRATAAARPDRLGALQPSFTAEGVPVHVLPVGRPVAFSVGLRQPRVVLSRGLLELLADDERRAVIAHEVAHARGGHLGPLFLAQVVGRALGELPPVRWASAALRRELEAAADEHAARAVGDREVVAVAIAKVALADSAAFRAGAFAGGADIAYRIERLLAPGPGSRLRDAVALGLVGTLVAATVVAQCGALHAGALWAGVASCLVLGWVGTRPLRPIAR